MGYWSIVIEGSGAHHNPDHVFDANRMADDLVIKLRSAGHDIKRAAFLYDYADGSAGQKLPYLNKPWPTPEPVSIVFDNGGPWAVVKVPGGNGVADHYRITYNGKLSHGHNWATVPGEDWREGRPGVPESRGGGTGLIGEVIRYNEAAAKDAERRAGLKTISGGAPEWSLTEAVPGIRILTNEDGHVTTYTDRPADGLVFKARSERPGEDPFEWEENYDLDLGSDVYLRWTHGGGDPEGSQPIGAHIWYRDPVNPSGWGGGGMTFSTADRRWRVWKDQDGVEHETATWTVESWAPLTVSPSLLVHSHMSAYGQTKEKHGFIRYGRWVEA